MKDEEIKNVKVEDTLILIEDNENEISIEALEELSNGLEENEEMEENENE